LATAETPTYKLLGLLLTSSGIFPYAENALSYLGKVFPMFAKQQM
jgi:hypothetical protein